MKNVKSCYLFWLEKADKILKCYRAAPSYQLFAETSFAVIAQARQKSIEGKREGKEIFPNTTAFLKITKLLTLSRMIIHNRLRRLQKPIPLLRKDSIPDEQLKFTFQTKDEAPPAPKKTVKEEELFHRINDTLESMRTKEGLQAFNEARQIITAYAMNLSHKSIIVFSHVMTLLYYYQRAIEDGVAIKLGGVANESF